MGAPRLNELPAEHETNDVLSYADAIETLRDSNRRRASNAIRGAYIIPLPRKKPEPYATVEMDYAGDFSDHKDPVQYTLDVLGFN